jgi:UDPglucose 6-dehydrogenase/GDP-mannose 6-dehydrogenase
VGLVTGVCLAEKGHRVICVDIDKEKVKKINDGISPIFEDGLEDLLKKNTVNKHLIASTNLKKAVTETEISIIAVSTPFVKGKVELSYLQKAAKEIGIALKEQNAYHVVIVKSTVPPGTTNEVVLPILEKYSEKKGGENFGVGMNPEFLREGCAISDFMNPDRIVIGGIDKKTIDHILELYKPFKGADVLIRNNRTAEMIKYASNSLLATLISFSNEIANICALTQDVDVKEVMQGVHLDKRLNPILDGGRVNTRILSYLEAGCGFGGSCFPKDVKSLISYAGSKGEDCELLRSVMEVNQKQPEKLIQLLRKHNASFRNLNVAILGLAFKPNTDDMRESPAIPVIKSLLQEGAHVKAYDPAAKEGTKKMFGTKNIEYPDSLKATLLGVDAVILITRWKEFDNLKILMKEFEPQPLIIDGRRMLNKKDYNKYEGVGLNVNERLDAT